MYNIVDTIWLSAVAFECVWGGFLLESIFNTWWRKMIDLKSTLWSGIYDISDIIGLWFLWSVREGNYYKLLAKLTIGCNLVEILRGGRGLLLAHLMSSWEAICQIFTTVGGRAEETSVKGQTNILSGKIWWEQSHTDEKGQLRHFFNLKFKFCSRCAARLLIGFLHFVIDKLYELFEQAAIWALG